MNGTCYMHLLQAMKLENARRFQYKHRKLLLTDFVIQLKVKAKPRLASIPMHNLERALCAPWSATPNLEQAFFFYFVQLGAGALFVSDIVIGKSGYEYCVSVCNRNGFCGRLVR